MGDFLFGKDCRGKLDDSAELAFVGCEVEQDDACSAFVNKTGGRAALLKKQAAPRCAGCKAVLALVLQAHLPLAEPPDNKRQLLVFVCTNPACKLPPAQRFAAYRAKVAPPAPAAAPEETPEPAAPSFGGGALFDEGSWDLGDATPVKAALLAAPVAAPPPPPQPRAAQHEDAPGFAAEAAEHSFAPYYLDADEEPDASACAPSAADDAQVKELLARYEKERAQAQAAAAEASKEQRAAQEDDGGYDVYEHTGGDRALRRFQKRVRRAPEQVLRWCYGGRPLQLSDSLPLAAVCVPRCPRCGSRRVFEAQLMPALLEHLLAASTRTEKDKAEAEAGAKAFVPPLFEFGSVLVCTCEQDCDTGGALAAEHVVWQPCPA